MFPGKSLSFFPPSTFPAVPTPVCPGFTVSPRRLCRQRSPPARRLVLVHHHSATSKPCASTRALSPRAPGSRARRTGFSPTWSAKSRSASGRATGACGTRSSMACAATSRRCTRGRTLMSAAQGVGSAASPVAPYVRTTVAGSGEAARLKPCAQCIGVACGCCCAGEGGVECLRESLKLRPAATSLTWCKC